MNKIIKVNQIKHPYGKFKIWFFKRIKKSIQKFITFFASFFVELKNDDQILISSATHAPWISDKEFFLFYKKINEYTLLDEPRAFTLWQMSKNLRNIDASIVDVGCLMGGSGFILSRANKKGNVLLYDSFEGFNENDGLHKKETFYYNDLNMVKKNIKYFKLKNTYVEKTFFPHNLKKKINRIKICHLDVNTFSETKKSFDWVDKKLIKNGIIIFDDFGIWGVDGIKRFVHLLEKKKSKDYIFIKNYFGQCILIKKN